MITDPPPMPPSVITLALEAPDRVWAISAAAAALPESRTGAAAASAPKVAALAPSPNALTRALIGTSAEAASAAASSSGGASALAATMLASSGHRVVATCQDEGVLGAGLGGSRGGREDLGGREAAAGAAPGLSGSASPAAVQPLFPSLQDCCFKVIHRNLSVYNCLELLAVSRSVEAPGFDTLAAASLRFAVNSFETLKVTRSEEELRLALSVELYDSLASAQRERLQAVSEMRRVGRAVERVETRAAARDVPSAAGRPMSYPAKALLHGVCWPPDVDGTRREEWLSPEDFEQLFGGLSWEDYCRLPAWKRTRLKQAAGLF